MKIITSCRFCVSGVAEQLSLVGVSWNCIQHVGRGCRCFKGLTGAGRSSSNVTHSCGWHVVGGLSSLAHRPLTQTELLECPHDMVTGFHQSEWSKTEQGRNGNAFYELLLEVTHHHFHNIFMLHWSAQFNEGREYTKAWIPGDEAIGGHLLRLVTTVRNNKTTKNLNIH